MPDRLAAWRKDQCKKLQQVCWCKLIEVNSKNGKSNWLLYCIVFYSGIKASHLQATEQNDINQHAKPEKATKG